MKAMTERKAIEILGDCDQKTISRKELATAVWRKLDPDFEEREPGKFRQQVRNLARYFGRLKHGELAECAAKRGEGRDQEILSFSAPGRGRSAG